MSIIDYPYKMIRDGRVCSIIENGKVIAIVFFSLCNDETQYLWNWNYEYHSHNPNGKILVLEGLVCRDFNFKIVKKMKEIFYAKFPQIEKTVWRRDNHSNKKFTFTRRNYEFQHSN